MNKRNPIHKTMKLQILGTGCAKCNHLLEVATRAVSELALDCTVEKVADFTRFAEFRVMITPALVVDGKVKVSGRVPSLDEMKKILAGSGGA